MLGKKSLRDIAKYKTQFISIFLMAFLGVFVFTGISSEYMGLEDNVNDYYEESNLADGWIYSQYLNDLFLEQVDLLGATTQMERQLVMDSVAGFEDKPDIKLHFVENNTVSKFYLLEGHPLDINDSEGVWLDKSFADARGLKVGDSISFESNGYAIEKEIRGLGYSPEHIFQTTPHSIMPNHTKTGFAYMSHKAFPEDPIAYNVLNVKFDGSPNTYLKLLDYRLNGYYTTFLQKSEHPSIYQVSEEISEHEMMADIFPIVFIMLSLLILLTTMKRIIAHQRTQIAILKANGFKNITLSIHYISYGFWMVLSGSILGLILGPRLVPPIFYTPMTRSYDLPVWSPGGNDQFIFFVVLMAIFSVLASYHAVSSISNEKPSIALRPRVPKASTSGFVESLKIWNRLSFNLRWNYRDAKRNKLRSLMTIIGVMGCSALLIGSIGLYDSLDDAREWEYNHINHYDSKLIIDAHATVSQIDEASDDTGGDKIMDKSIKIESDNTGKLGSVLVLNDTSLITPSDENMNRIEIGNDEVSISQKMADMLNVGIGDAVKWHIMDSDKWVITPIDKIHASPIYQGLILSPDKLDELGLNYTPTDIITSQNVNRTYDGIKTTLSLEDIESSWNETTKTLWRFINIFVFFACLLAVIVLYNLGLLTFTEIEREIATLKVMGFKSSYLRRLLLAQNLILTTIGFILGVPLGLFLLDLIWSSSETSFYVIPTLTVTHLAVSAAIIFSLAVFVNLLFSNKIKSINMVESLKDYE